MSIAYWQAWDLMSIDRSGEYRKFGRNYVTVFGNPDKYEVISERSMNAFRRKGLVCDTYLVTTGDPIVKVTKEGRIAYHRYFANYHRKRVKSWEEIKRKQEATSP